MVDAKTLQAKAVLVQPERSQLADADMDKAGRWAVGVVGVRALTDGIQWPERHYWRQRRDLKTAEGMKNDVPVLPLIDLSTGAVQALPWPNLETLTAP